MGSWSYRACMEVHKEFDNRAAGNSRALLLPRHSISYGETCRGGAAAIIGADKRSYMTRDKRQGQEQLKLWSA